MALITDYREGDGASHALAAKLAQELGEAVAEPVFRGPNWAVLRSGAVVDARNMGNRPPRRIGRHTTFEPGSFASLVSRLADADTTIWADRDASELVAVLNDHPATRFVQQDDDHDGLDTIGVEAGHGDHTAALRLAVHDDFQRWTKHDGTLIPQREFGEHVEDMAHTFTRPDAATMLEIATTLTMKQTLDYTSRTRLDNGDIQFQFEQESQTRAGRGAKEIAIPQAFEFTCPVWEGTEPVEFEARLRYRAQAQGVSMGYRITRRADVVRQAFQEVIVDVTAAIPPYVPIYLGRATR